jgi:phospholipid/cholesterol/gamma-HCH transport system ATP-binding protein
VTTSVIDGLILRMAQELNVTSVVVTHDMKSAYRVADRIAMLYDGAIRWVGTPAELDRVEDTVVKGFIEGRPELAQEHVA